MAEWQALGKKVIMSFGGAGMGGSWNGDTNNCWDYCFDKEDTVSTQLVAIVGTEGYDGVDLDYEYCYDMVVMEEIVMAVALVNTLTLRHSTFWKI